MPKEIIWSPLAEKDFDNISEYLVKEWSINSALQFISLVDHLIDHISMNPKQFPEINHNLKVRKCVISKHNCIYYKVSSRQIDILRIFDSRQDPNKLKIR